MKQIKLKAKAKIGLTVFLTCLIIVIGCGGYHLKNTIIQNNRAPITLSNKENTVVFFYKDTCSDCRKIFNDVMFKKDFEHVNVKLVNLNNEKNKNYILKYNLHYVPTFITLRNGKEINRYTGTNMNKINTVFKGAEKW